MSGTTSKDNATVSAPRFTALVDLVSHARFWLVASLILWFDLWSKKWIFAHLKPDETRSFIANFIDFRRSINDGAVFGLFTGQVGLFIVASLFAFVFVFYLFASSHRTQWPLHIALGLILSGALGNLYDRSVEIADVVVYKTKSGQHARLAGKIISEPEDEIVRIGNYPEGLHPRSYRRTDIVEIRTQGVVRDFIKFVPRFPAWVPKLAGRDMWPWVFNIADAALVCGVGVLLCSSWLSRYPDKEE